MCIKWIRENFHSVYEEKQKINEEEQEERESLLGNPKNDTENFSIEEKAGFKKWYLEEFSKELEDDCFKSLIASSK